MSDLKYDDIFQIILDRINILKNEIHISIQSNTIQETEKCIDVNFDLLCHDIKYQIYKVNRMANIENMRFVICSYNYYSFLEELFHFRLLKELQKARQIIQLQTLSSTISNKISEVIKTNESDES